MRVQQEDLMAKARHELVRFFRYAVPVVLIALGWLFQAEIVEHAANIDVAGAWAWTKTNVQEIDWQAAGVLMSTVWAFAASVVLGRRRWTWSAKHVGAAVREEAERLGSRTSVLLALPAIWDVVLMIPAFFKGFERRGDPMPGTAGEVAAAAHDRLECLRNDLEMQRKEYQRRFKELDRRVGDKDFTATLGALELIKTELTRKFEEVETVRVELANAVKETKAQETLRRGIGIIMSGGGNSAIRDWAAKAAKEVFQEKEASRA